MMDRRYFLTAAGVGVAGAMAGNLLAADAVTPVEIDAGRVTGAFPHYWEKCVGSDRTMVAFREPWVRDLIRVRREAGVESVRCHGLFNDEMGVCTKDASGYRYNFLYVDQIYDRMLELGVRPFVELSFMPSAMASGNSKIFFYRGNVTPPARMEDWGELIRLLADHLVKRYGMAEVGQWKFEVWNEPNINFWAGTQEEYFEMYRHSAMAIKSVDRRLQVGGPSTAALKWVPEFLKYCAAKDVPVDFVSTHVYPTDAQTPLFGKERSHKFEDVMPVGIRAVKQQVEASHKPNLPLWITEWAAQNPAFIADTTKRLAGVLEAMSYWTFSPVFEENGVPGRIFGQTFGMLDQWNIPRPSLHTFALMHRLGDQQLASNDAPVMATRRADGSLAVLVWNLISRDPAINPERVNYLSNEGACLMLDGPRRTFHFKFQGLNGRKSARVTYVDDKRGCAVPAWRAMGSPQYPTREQIQQLRAAGELQPAEVVPMRQGNPAELTLELPPEGIALLEFDR